MICSLCTAAIIRVPNDKKCITTFETSKACSKGRWKLPLSCSYPFSDEDSEPSFTKHSGIGCKGYETVV